jgi:hypothetical protein
VTAFEQFSQRLIPRRIYGKLEEFIPVSNSVYLSGKTREERDNDLFKHVQEQGIATALLVDLDDKSFIFSYNDNDYSIGLTNGREQKAIWEQLNVETIYLDITSLSHRIWAILLKSAKRVGQKIEVLYIEPRDYSRNDNEEGSTESYDLSESYLHFQGLPGFSSLDATYDDNVSYVPLLGFEGVRFQLATTDAVPPANKTFPIIGLPGFRPEYPFEAFIENKPSLVVEGDSILPNVIFTDASCPFCLYYILEDLSLKYEEDIIKIALIGTKPHALGAILFAMHKGPGEVQLLYDYPLKKTGRTSGIGRIHQYHVSFFFSMMAELAV